MNKYFKYGDPKKALMHAYSNGLRGVDEVNEMIRVFRENGRAWGFVGTPAEE